MDGKKYHFVNTSAFPVSGKEAELANSQARSHAAKISHYRSQGHSQCQQALCRDGKSHGSSLSERDVKSFTHRFRVHVAKSPASHRTRSLSTRWPPHTPLDGYQDQEEAASHEHSPQLTQGTLKKTKARRAEIDILQTDPALQLTAELNILEMVRHSVWPLSDRLDPFACFPVTLDRSQEHLLSFYLGHYPKAAYGFSPHLQPHPVTTIFSLGLIAPACFQVFLARSASLRLSLKKYASQSEMKALEFAMIHHKGEALRIVRALGGELTLARKGEFLGSVISLAMLDRRNGADEAAGPHQAVVRKVLGVTGGPLSISSLLQSRLICFIECMYGTSRQSFVWDKSDLRRLLGELNGLLYKVWGFCKSLQGNGARTTGSAPKENTYNRQGGKGIKRRGTEAECQLTRSNSFGLRPGSALLSLLERQPSAVRGLTQAQRMELMFQVACLLTLATVMVDLADDPGSLQLYMDDLHKIIEDRRLVGYSCNNIMWQIQISDHSEAQTRRVWCAASCAWVMKHTSYNVQAALKDWLLRFLIRKPVGRLFRLSPFHFSLQNAGNRME